MVVKVFLGIVTSELFLNSLLGVAGFAIWLGWTLLMKMYTFPPYVVPLEGVEPLTSLVRSETA